MKTKTFAISGHGNLTFEEWLEHYKPLIDNALQEDASFILGEFRGADVLCLEYLKNKTAKVTVLHCFNKPRYKVDVIDLPSKEWQYLGGFTSDLERDVYMTQMSDADIAWVRAGKERSGTAKNLMRRLEKKP